MSGTEWTTADHASRYLDRADEFPHRLEGESVILELVPSASRRVLDLGTGDGRMLALLEPHCPDLTGIGLDFSQPMMEAARRRFDGSEKFQLSEHDLTQPLPEELGGFDVIISSFVIHHFEDSRKQELYGEIFERLEPGGIFLNMEHVSAPTRRLHLDFFAAIGERIEDEDPSDKLRSVEQQLGWLRAIGFDHVDCFWKWREMALLAAIRPN